MDFKGEVRGIVRVLVGSRRARGKASPIPDGLGWAKGFVIASGLDDSRESADAVPVAGTVWADHYPLHGGFHLSTRSRSSSRRAATPPTFWWTWMCVAP